MYVRGDSGRSVTGAPRGGQWEEVGLRLYLEGGSCLEESGGWGLLTCCLWYSWRGSR